MSSTWIVREPAGAEGPSWSLRVAGEEDEVTTYPHLSAHQAKLALYRVMFGLTPVEGERHLSAVAGAGRQPDVFADAA